MERLPGDDTTWLVADNEVRGRLFAFRNEVSQLVPKPDHDAVGRDTSIWPKDVEALAVRGRELFVVGSHGRGGGCRAAKGRARRRILRVEMRHRRIQGIRTVSGERVVRALQEPGATLSSCQAALFRAPPPPLSREVCTALLEAEASATASACKTLNLEAAAVIPGADRAGRLWLGLRSPLADGQAILLRVDETGSRADETVSELRFDGAVLLDLEGRGLRALDAVGDRLFGLATAESRGAVLFRSPLPRADLAVSGLTLRPRILIEGLSGDAEGLSVSRGGNEAWIVTDGANSGDPGRCKLPAGQLRVRW